MTQLQDFINLGWHNSLMEGTALRSGIDRVLMSLACEHLNCLLGYWHTREETGLDQTGGLTQSRNFLDLKKKI